MLSLLQGDCVEVAFTDRDYEHSWALAVVQRATNGNHTCSISYNDFYMDEGGVVNVVEDVEVSRLRRASTVGLRDVALQDYRAGDSVELWDDCLWWEAEVVEEMRAAGRLVIQLAAPGKALRVATSPADVRPALAPGNGRGGRKNSLQPSREYNGTAHASDSQPAAAGEPWKLAAPSLHRRPKPGQHTRPASSGGRGSGSLAAWLDDAVPLSGDDDLLSDLVLLGGDSSGPRLHNRPTVSADIMSLDVMACRSDSARSTAAGGSEGLPPPLLQQQQQQQQQQRVLGPCAAATVAVPADAKLPFLDQFGHVLPLPLGYPTPSLLTRDAAGESCSPPRGSGDASNDGIVSIFAPGGPLTGPAPQGVTQWWGGDATAGMVAQQYGTNVLGKAGANGHSAQRGALPQQPQRPPVRMSSLLVGTGGATAADLAAAAQAGLGQYQGDSQAQLYYKQLQLMQQQLQQQHHRQQQQLLQQQLQEQLLQQQALLYQQRQPLAQAGGAGPSPQAFLDQHNQVQPAPPAETQARRRPQTQEQPRVVDEEQQRAQVLRHQQRQQAQPPPPPLSRHQEKGRAPPPPPPARQPRRSSPPPPPQQQPEQPRPAPSVRPGGRVQRTSSAGVALAAAAVAAAELDTFDGSRKRPRGPSAAVKAGLAPKQFNRRSDTKRAWKLNETQALVSGVQRLGVGKWAKIKNLGFSELADRTAIDLKDKWRNLRRSVLMPAQKQTGTSAAVAAASASRTHLTTPLTAFGEEPSPFAEEFQRMASMMQTVREIVLGLGARNATGLEPRDGEAAGAEGDAEGDADGDGDGDGDAEGEGEEQLDDEDGME